MKPETDHPEARPSRRSLLSAAAVTSAGLGVLGLLAAWARSLWPDVLYEPPEKRRIGDPGDYPDGATFLPDERVFLLHDKGSFRALSAICTHLGCTVSREGEGGYHCPCHGSTFSPTGKNTGGPAPRPLPWHPLTLGGDGSLVVDLGREVGPEATLEVPGTEATG
ncbi:MAG: ubiquinol-cytochrome c reductase iron-sulfur subunit [Planctomycetota bacterium]